MLYHFGLSIGTQISYRNCIGTLLPWYHNCELSNTTQYIPSPYNDNSKIKSLSSNNNDMKKQLWFIKFFLIACTNDMFNLTLQAFNQEKEQGGLYCI